MQVNEAILKRRSVRAYQAKPVDADLITKIFTEAQQSPSNCNTQPWHVVVVSGDARDQVEQAMIAEIMSGKAPSPHFTPGDHQLKDEYRKRQIDCAIALYDAMDIKYEEKQKRQELMVRNWQFFGAPHAAFFSMPKGMSEINAVDMGIYLQSLMLLMTQLKQSTNKTGDTLHCLLGIFHQQRTHVKNVKLRLIALSFQINT